MKIGGKLVVGFVAVALLGAAVGIFGIISMRRIDTADTFLYEKTTVPLGALADFGASVNRKRAVALQAVISDDPGYMDAQAAAIETRDKVIEIAKATYEKTLIDDADRALFAKMREAETTFDSQLTEPIAMARANETEKAGEYVKSTFQKTTDEPNAILDERTKLNVAAVQATSEGNTKLATSTTVIMIIMIILVTIASVVIGFILSFSISKPLGIAVTHLGEMANGYLRNDIPEVYLKRSDEMGDLAKALNTLSRDLRRIVESILSATDQVSSGSEQISSTAQQLSQGAAELAVSAHG